MIILAILIIFKKLKRKFIAIYYNVAGLSVKFWQIEYNDVPFFSVKLIINPYIKRKKLTHCSKRQK